MARIEDYVKNDTLDTEIIDAQVQSESRRSVIPDRFAEKSREEIAASYKELESAYSRQGNDLGVMRKQVDELVGLQLLKSEPQDQTPAVTLDNLYDDADGTIRQVAESVANSRIEGLEQKLEEVTREKDRTKFEETHPDWQVTLGTPEFQNWVAEKPYRQSLAKQADAWDFDAAGDLFGLYNGEQQPTQQGNIQREQQLRDATLETSGAALPDLTTNFSRSKLMNVRIKAKAGNEEAKSYLRVKGAEIQLAYAEGRIVD